MPQLKRVEQQKRAESPARAQSPIPKLKPVPKKAPEKETAPEKVRLQDWEMIDHKMSNASFQPDNNCLNFVGQQT